MAGPFPSEHFVVAVDPESPPPGLAGAVVAIGNFDGLHRGHLAVIRAAEAMGASLARPCAVLTFEPHPSDYFGARGTIFRLTPMPLKAKALERLGLDGMIVLTFDAALAGLTAEDFVADILVRQLGVGGIVAGYDFHFGKGRSGTPAFLREAGQRHGFAVEIVAPVAIDQAGGGQAASSTATRAALEKGDVETAAKLLGHPYWVVGEVLHGQKLGRTIGVPTANLMLEASCRLRHGVYAVEATIDGRRVKGVANYGRRPTVAADGPALLEVHLFDFAGDLYGRELEVAFIGFIRGEQKFPSFDALKAQIAADAETARKIFRDRAGGRRANTSPEGDGGAAGAG